MYSHFGIEENVGDRCLKDDGGGVARRERERERERERALVPYPPTHTAYTLDGCSSHE
jgi:hypothetical protein